MGSVVQANDSLKPNQQTLWAGCTSAWMDAPLRLQLEGAE